MNKAFNMIVVLLILGLFFFMASSGLAVRDIHVNSVSTRLKLLTLNEDEIRELIPLKKGDIFTVEKLEDAKKALLDTGLFESVETKVNQKGIKADLVFTLIEARHIRNISIKGNLPYLEKRILRLSSLQAGEPFREDLMRQSAARIRDFFEKEGFFGTQVMIDPPKAVAKNMVDLKIRIKKGTAYRMGNVSIEGNTVFSTPKLHNKIFSSGRFNPRKLKRTLKKIEKKYIVRGYVRSRVKLAQAQEDEQQKQVNISVDVSERSKLLTQFKGNSFFRAATLRNHTTFYEERGYDRFALERSVEKLGDFYRVNGFLEATIEAKLMKEDNLRRALFTVHEGPRTRLKKIIFKGNEKMASGELEKAMTNEKHTPFRQGFFQEDKVENDLERITQHYVNSGFFDARVLSYTIDLNSFHDQADLTIEVDEGRRYRLTDISVHGNEHIPTTDILNKADIKNEKFYESRKIEKARKRILQMYHEQGFPHVNVVFEKYSNEPGVADLDIVIEEGNLTTIRNIIVNGQLLTKEKVIREALKMKSGDLYSYNKTLNAQLNLKRLGIFDYVHIQPMGLEEKRDEIDLVVNTTERKDKTFDIQAGFDSDKLGTGQIIFIKRNLFGLGKQIQFRALGGFELDRGEVTFYSPRIFGASWNLVNQYFIQYQDAENFNATSFGGSLGVVKNFGPDWTVLLKSQVTRFNIFESQSNRNALDKNLFDNTFSETSASFFYDTRDNFADPHKGVYAMASTEFDTDLSNLRNNFNISTLNASHYWGLSKRLTLINTFRLGYLAKINSESRLPATKLFFMGGNNTVRGFDEDAIRSSGGTTSLIYNAELDLRVFNNFKLAGFFDIGSLTDRFSDISLTSLRDSAGAGIRYITPVGPIRLDYGFVLDKKPGEKGQRFHFSFGYFF